MLGGGGGGGGGEAGKTENLFIFATAVFRQIKQYRHFPLKRKGKIIFYNNWDSVFTIAGTWALTVC